MPLKFNGIFIKLLHLQYQTGKFNYIQIFTVKYFFITIAFLIFFLFFAS
jgi:hypothetical protein